MVDEFSSFARMPQLSLKNENLSEICRGVMTLETNRHLDIDYDADLPADNIRLYCDHRQVFRALTNLFKNAAEAIIGRKEDQGDKAPKGQIHAAAAPRTASGPSSGCRVSSMPFCWSNASSIRRSSNISS